MLSNIADLVNKHYLVTQRLNVIKMLCEAKPLISYMFTFIFIRKKSIVFREKRKTRREK